MHAMQDMDTEVYGNIEHSLIGHSLILPEEGPFYLNNAQVIEGAPCMACSSPCTLSEQHKPFRSVCCELVNQETVMLPVTHRSELICVA